MTYAVQPFESVEKLIYWQIHKFLARKGGDFAELLSLAGEAYCRARDTYDPAKRVKFSTWVCYRVWRKLLGTAWKAARKKNRQVGGLDLDAFPDRTESRPFLEDLTDGLSADARHMVGLALDPALGLARIRGSRDNKGKKLAGLLQDLGWAGKRVAECFREVREALYPV